MSNKDEEEEPKMSNKDGEEELKEALIPKEDSKQSKVRKRKALGCCPRHCTLISITIGFIILVLS